MAKSQADSRSVWSAPNSGAFDRHNPYCRIKRRNPPPSNRFATKIAGNQPAPSPCSKPCRLTRLAQTAVLLFCAMAADVQASTSQPNVTNESASAFSQFFAGTNLAQIKKPAMKSATDFQARLRMARNHRLTRDFAEAATDYAGVLEGGAPEALQRTVLLELAQLALEQNDLARAQQVLAQWIERWPKDPAVPEVLLRQGLVFRQMGLHSRAIAKFYGVMTSSLVLKPGRFEYYQQLVLRAQNEIADVQFDLGNYAEAAESLNRLLRLESPPADRSRTQHRYIQCLIALGRGAA